MQILLALHIAAAALFLGSLATSALWKVRADRSNSMEAMIYASRSLLFADLAFTGPGIVGVLVTGFWMVSISGWDRFQELWLAISLLLIVLVAGIWVAVLLPLQFRMLRFARLQARNVNTDPAYRRASKIWASTSGIATLMTWAVLFLMVLRPLN